LEASRHATELKTDAHITTVTKPENKNQDHLRPVSGQGSALCGVHQEKIKFVLEALETLFLSNLPLTCDLHQ
jgi:hypothetical protein